MVVNRSVVWATAIVVGIALAALTWWLTPWGSLPADLPVADASNDFTAAQIASAHEFRSTLRALSIGSVVLGIAVLCAIAFTRAGQRWFADIVERLPENIIIRSALAVVALTSLVYLIRLPIAIASERIARREGLSTSSWASWSADQGKGLALSLIFSTVAVVVLVLLARWQPRTWWITASAGAALMAIVLSFVFPVVVEPLFNRFTPMEQGRLRASLLAMAERDRVPVKEVLVADASRRTTALNAYVSGFGATRRVVVYDTLLREAPEAEVEMVVAHELGHAQRRDVLRGTVIGAVAAVLGVLLLALLVGSAVGTSGGIAAILAWLAIFAFVQQPFAGAVSREIEARADQHALNLTRDPQTFAEMQQRLAVTNRADVIAPRWVYLLFASHPSTRERLALARWWAQKNGVDAPAPLVAK